METKQCIFVDEEKTVHSGIYFTEDNDDNYIICLCRGGIIDPKEVIYKTFENWIIFDELFEIAKRKNEEVNNFAESRNLHSFLSGRLRRY